MSVPDPVAAAPESAPDTTAASAAPVDESRPRWKRNVAIFLAGQTASLFGSMLVQYAIMWHLTLITKSGVVMALAAIFGFLPQAIVSIFGGVWADRMNRKLLIIIADSTIALTTLGLALVMLTGYDGLWLIYLTLAIRSAGAGIQMPAVAALIPQITPTAQLMRVNGINSSIQSAMALLAPAVAALVYANMTIVAIFFIDVVTAIIGIGLLLLVPVATIRSAADTAVGYFADLVDGVRYVARHGFVRWLLAVFAIVFLLAAGPSYLTPLMLVRSFGDEVWMLTVLEIAFSVGMTLAGMLIAIWAGSKNRIAMIVATSIAFGVITLGLGLSPNMWVFFGFMFLFGLAVPYFSTPAMTLLQEKVEPERQGRVFGFVGIVMAVAMPLGMGVLGPLADVFRVEALLSLCGITMIIVIVIAVTVPAGRRAMAAASAPTETQASSRHPPRVGGDQGGLMLVAFSVAPNGGESPDGSMHDAVAAAVRVVRESGLPHRTDAMFTTIEGEWDEVFDVVKRATDAVAAYGPRVSLVLKADIRPGHTGELDGKVERLEKALDADA